MQLTTTLIRSAKKLSLTHVDMRGKRNKRREKKEKKEQRGKRKRVREREIVEERKRERESLPLYFFSSIFLF